MIATKELRDVCRVPSVARRQSLRVAASALACAFAAMLAVGTLEAATTCPPLTVGFWKNHQSAWKVTSLTLGTTTYTAAQLETILQTPSGGDASLILADQLIAALLSIANGTDPAPVAATIANANALLGAGPIPEHVKASSVLGQQMVSDAAILDNYNEGNVTTACGIASSSCQPSSAVSVLVSGANVVAYVAKGSWTSSTTGVSAVNVEGSSITNTLIPTPNVVNSCSSNPLTGQTVCTANNTDVYSILGTTLGSTLTSGGSGAILFSGGLCTNCGVSMDAIHDKAALGLSIASVAGFQYLDLASSLFEPAFMSDSSQISEGPLIDPTRNLLLSAAENGTYEIVNVATTTSPTFFENVVGGFLDSSAEDCGTGIALASLEFTDPSQVYLADLTQATFTPGSPGSWSAPSQIQTLTESDLGTGVPAVGGIAVAQGTFTGVLGQEFLGNSLTAISLPTTSGIGTPALSDWVTCQVGGSFANGFDPHTVTAYKSPSTGHAVALLTDASASTLAVVDLTNMLDPTIVPRTGGGHGCASTPLPGSVVSFLSVP